MKKIVWTFGLIAGLIMVLMFFITGAIWEDKMDFNLGEVVGYVTMIASLSTVFFGIKAYRDKHLNGHINFGKAFVVGLYISLVASVIYVIGWMIYSHFFMPDFMDRYAEFKLQELKNDNASPDEIADYEKNMNWWREKLKNPFISFGITFMEIFPVGFIISVISAAILKRKPKPGAGM